MAGMFLFQGDPMKKIKVNKRVLRRLKRIRVDLGKRCILISIGFVGVNRKSVLCPEWKGPSSWLKNCYVCSEYFPKVKTHTDMTHACPCYLYTPAYLIRRLTQIIQDSEDRN